MGRTLHEWLVQHPISQSVIINSLVGLGLTVVGSNWKLLLTILKQPPQRFGAWWKQARFISLRLRYTMLLQAKENIHYFYFRVFSRLLAISSLLGVMLAEVTLYLLFILHPTEPVSWVRNSVSPTLLPVFATRGAQTTWAFFPLVFILWFSWQLLRFLFEVARFDDTINRYGMKMSRIKGSLITLEVPGERRHSHEEQATAPASEPLTKVARSSFDNRLIVGHQVEHPKYGRGHIRNLEGVSDNEKITIEFAASGVKKLVTKFAQLRPI